MNPNTNEPRKIRYQQQLRWGITALAVICLGILFFFAVYRWNGVAGGIGTLRRILQPFVVGAVLAWLLVPLYNICERALLPRLTQSEKKPGRGALWTKAICIVICIVVLLGVLTACVTLIVPQVISSLVSIVNNSETYIETVTQWASTFMEKNPELATWITDASENLLGGFSDFAKGTLLPWLSSLLGKLSVQLIGAFRFLLNFVIGIIVCIYMLAGKRTLAGQAKRFCYSAFKTERANTVIRSARYVNTVFSGFISGKLLDSLIIGIICFIGVTVMRMPYPFLISVIICVTNIIPCFGPFIGAIPTALLILLADPIKCVYFVIFIIVLQQIDGNIIGPKILGEAVGISAMWIMFAILVGGGFWGFAGMLLGVPVFTCIYTLCRWLIERALKKKGMAQETEYYMTVGSIDAETGAVSAIPEKKHAHKERRKQAQKESK